MTTTHSPTDPTNTDIHGPDGHYTLVVKATRRDDGIAVINAKSPRPYGHDHLTIGVHIIDGYTVANNVTFAKIIGALGWDLESVAGFLHPDGRTVWLDEQAAVDA